MQNGKGDRQRPRFVSYHAFSARWDKAFSRPLRDKLLRKIRIK
jgi:hypothetical protein